MKNHLLLLIMKKPPSTMTRPSLKPPMSASRSQIEYTRLSNFSPFVLRSRDKMFVVVFETGTPRDYSTSKSYPMKLLSPIGFGVLVK